MAEHVYKPSEAVPVSGVYRVEHHAHRETHDATLLEGEIFPACATCDHHVRFTLRHKADTVGKDKDLSSGS
jgi:hypothetical protein